MSSSVTTEGRRTPRPARPGEVVEKAANPQGLQRRQTAVIRDLIHLDLATPRFETEGLALIRSLLEED